MSKTLCLFFLRKPRIFSEFCDFFLYFELLNSTKSKFSLKTAQFRVKVFTNGKQNSVKLLKSDQKFDLWVLNFVKLLEKLGRHQKKSKIQHYELFKTSLYFIWLNIYFSNYSIMFLFIIGQENSVYSNNQKTVE